MDNKNEIWLRISSWTLNSSFIIHLINYFSFDGFLFISLQFGNFKSVHFWAEFWPDLANVGKRRAKTKELFLLQSFGQQVTNELKKYTTEQILSN